jgi:UDP-N-acetylmuramoylalanine--D-glutamate ligase
MKGNIQMIRKQQPRFLGDLAGMHVTIMGLGLHGGGLASAAFFAKAGAIVTVTDTRSETELTPSIAALSAYPIRYVLGKHEIDDFSRADLVIKNPAVKKTSPFLAAARMIETDISIFLRFSKAPIIAVTGSKGKSTVSSAIQHGFSSSGRRSLLGGNITLSPLTFLDQTDSSIPVILELSSWQLADMRGLGVLKPKVAVITSILPDHMNYYSSMGEYVADKRLIYENQQPSDYTLFDADQYWGKIFQDETVAHALPYSNHGPLDIGAWLEDTPPHCAKGFCRITSATAMEEILPAKISIVGDHQRKNLLAAGLALRVMGISPSEIATAMASFPGVEHRLEFFAESGNVRWFNDSASTIPQAVAAAMESFDEPILLITGGTDKNLDFSGTVQMYQKPVGIILLAGSATDKLLPILKNADIDFEGPFDTLEAAVTRAREMVKPGMIVLFSPGATSFGMFLHEFDRGLKFKATVCTELGCVQAPCSNIK